MRTQAAYIRLALADALIELMRERPYAEIGVSDVCERSGVGRTTFYRHCDCKGGMDCLLIFKLTEGWRSYELLHRDSLAANFGCTLLRYVYDNGELVSLMYENGLTEALRRAFDAMLSAAEIPDGEGGYLASFCSWGYFGIVCRWIERRLRRDAGTRSAATWARRRGRRRCAARVGSRGADGIRTQN